MFSRNTKLEVKLLLKISRPRFWIYVFGPYLLGIVTGAQSATDFLKPEIIVFAVFFLLPANILIYGVNDIFDFDTDRLNPKKSDYENRLEPSNHSLLAKWILIFNLPFIAAAFLVFRDALLSLSIFLFLAVFYSSPPLRTKSIPILDSVFNFLYVMPGIFSFQLLTGNWPPIRILLAAGLWTAAMHAFSAVPDIEADRKSGVNTIAVLLGRRGTIAACLAAYGISAILVAKYLGLLAIAIGALYILLMSVSLLATHENALFRVYKLFPLLNSLAGFCIFCFIALRSQGIFPYSFLPEL
ncbi:MAG: lycopene elongase [Blastocatellia bacterium]